MEGFVIEFETAPVDHAFGFGELTEAESLVGIDVVACASRQWHRLCYYKIHMNYVVGAIETSTNDRPALDSVGCGDYKKYLYSCSRYSRGCEGCAS